MGDFTIKDWTVICLYMAGGVILTYAMYKVFAVMIGKEVAAALVKAGIVKVI